jgi:hypothetical protein
MWPEDTKMIRDMIMPAPVVAAILPKTSSSKELIANQILQAIAGDKGFSETLHEDKMQIHESGLVLINDICANIRTYEIVVPEKVVRVYFVDGGVEKVVVHKDDKFDLDTGLRVAIAKHVGRKFYNLAGIEYLAKKLSYLKAVDKILHRAHVQYRKDNRDAEKKAKQQTSDNAEQTVNGQKRKLKIKTTHHPEK